MLGRMIPRLPDLAFPDAWQGVVLGGALALLWALGFGLARRRGLASLAFAAGCALAWVATLGLVTASPRQLPERLPLLALAALLLTAPLPRWPRLGWAVVLVLALGGGWWLAGGPLTWPDLRRAMPVAAGMAGLVLLIRARLDAPWPGVVAAAAALGALMLAGQRGPQVLLEAGVAAAALGAALARAPWGPVAPALALALAAPTALPVVARGAMADWVAAAAAPTALWLGPLVGARLPRRIAQWLGPALAALPLLVAAWWLR